MSEELKAKPKINYYLVLDIVQGASHNDILHAYNRAKNTYSSGSLASYTLIEDDNKSSILEDIETAFSILGNPARRREYDMEMGFRTWLEDENSQDRDAGRERIRVSPSVVSRPETTSARNEDIPKAEKTVYSFKTPNPSPPPPSFKESLIGVEFQPNLEFEKKIAECSSVDGSFLKAVRIYRCYTPDSLAIRCKLSPSHILTIENEDSPNMPQTVYLRGHVYLICQALELPNPDKLAKSYLDRMVAQGKIQKRVF